MEDITGIEGIVLNCNRLAMDYLKVENYKVSLGYLQKAEQLLQSDDLSKDKMRLLAITLNNFGCFYKRRSNYNLALKYLYRALSVEQAASGDPTNMAATHLNICAIYS
jgi:tetratricopeptide (TPR) repeat protein